MTDPEREARAILRAWEDSLGETIPPGFRQVEIALRVHIAKALRAAADRATTAQRQEAYWRDQVQPALARAAQAEARLAVAEKARDIARDDADAAEQECARLREELAAERERWGPAERDARHALRESVTAAQAREAQLRAALEREVVGCDTALDGEAHEGNHRTYCNLCKRIEYGHPCGDFSRLIHEPTCALAAVMRLFGPATSR